MTDVGLDPARLQVAYDLLDSWVAGGVVPAAAISISRNGQAIPARAFGHGAFADGRRAIDTDSVFLVASVTKPVTSLAVLQLVEAGRVSLGDPVQAYIDEFRGPGKEQIRVEQLLTHTSGLPDMLPENEALRSRHAGLDEFVAHVCRCDLLFSPGTQVSYQSMGTLLAGEIVSRVTGRALPDVLQTDVFTPLGMSSTVLGTRPDVTRQTPEVVLPDEQVGTSYHWNTEYWRRLGAPWGGMHSSVDDLDRLLRAMLAGGILEGERVLSPAMTRLMLSDRLERMPQLPADQRMSQRRGLGWRLGAWGDLGSPLSFSHGGATGTLVGADPTTGLACSVFTTCPGAPLQRVVTAVQAAVED